MEEPVFSQPSREAGLIRLPAGTSLPSLGRHRALRTTGTSTVPAKEFQFQTSADLTGLQAAQELADGEMVQRPVFGMLVEPFLQVFF